MNVYGGVSRVKTQYCVCVAIAKVPVLGKTTVEQRAAFTQKLPVKTQQVPNFLFTY